MAKIPVKWKKYREYRGCSTTIPLTMGLVCRFRVIVFQRNLRSPIVPNTLSLFISAIFSRASEKSAKQRNPEIPPIKEAFPR